MKTRKKRDAKRSASGVRHVCATSVKAGDTITLTGRALGYQPILVKVLAVECEAVIPARGAAVVTQHRPMLVVEDTPVPMTLAQGRVRGRVEVSFVYERYGENLEGSEEGQVTRRLTIQELRAWAVQCPLAGPMPAGLLDHLMSGVLA